MELFFRGMNKWFSKGQSQVRKQGTRFYYDRHIIKLQLWTSKYMDMTEETRINKSFCHVRYGFPVIEKQQKAIHRPDKRRR
jgi:hypothetical protein